METAVRYPDCVRGLVLAGCSADPVGPASIPFRTLAWVLEHAPRQLIDAANIAFFRVRYPRRLIDPILAGGFWPVGGAQALRQLIGRRYLERLERLWTPVVVVNGAFDPVFGPGGSTWAAACRRGREVTIPMASHLSNLDQPRTFARHVDAFLRELATPG
jgi:pimeloyl-ACP methyl ester carboxylesterase